MNRHKKLFAVLTLVCFLFTLMPVTAFAENAEITSGTCGKNATWSFDAETGTLTISGSGSMDQYLSFESTGWTEDLRPWKDYCNDIKIVVVEEGITELADYSLVNCYNVEKMKIGSTVTNLGAFLSRMGTNFSKLKTVGPVGGGYDVEFAWTTEIPEEAFANCYYIESVVLPETIVKIGQDAFTECDKLQEITLPESSLQEIGIRAFACCDNLLTIEIPDSVQILGNCAFDDCIKLENVTLPKTLNSIGIATFRGCESLKTVNLPDNLTVIDGLFEGCKSLSEIVIPNGVTEITAYSFEGCSSLEEVVIPESVEKIGIWAFSCCFKLKSVKILGENTDVSGTAFEGTPLRTAGPIGQSDYDYQFAWKKEIPDVAFAYDGGFGIALHEVTLPESIEIIGESAFRTNRFIKTIDLPESLKEIKEWAFDDCIIETITIPQNVETIGSYAFTRCDNLSTIIFEGSAPNLGYNCFDRVTATAYYDGDDSWTEEVRGNYGGNITWVSTAPEPEINKKLIIEYPEKAKLGETVSLEKLYYDLSDGRKEDISLKNTNIQLTGIGQAIECIDGNTGDITIKNDKQYIGDIITVTAYDEANNLTCSTSITIENNSSENSGSTGSGGGSSYTPSTNQSTDDITINNTNSNISVETSEVQANVISNAKQAVLQDNNTEIIGGVDCAVNISAEDKQGNSLDAFFTPLTVEIPVSSAALKSVDNISHITLAKVVTDANGNTSLVYMGGNYDTQSGLFTAYVDEPGDYVLVEDADVKKIELQIGSRATAINGTDKTSDVAPRIIDNHTYVPLRFIAEMLGCEVAWDEETRTVTITQNGITMKLVIDEKIAGYDVAAVIRENRTLVPLRYIAEQLGANVIWHPQTQEIVVVK